MTGNFDINKELLDAMRMIARQEIEKCNRDITKTARVIAVNTDKTVKIEMDGKQYDNIPNYNGTTLTTNDIVKVTYGDAVQNFSENEKIIMEDGKFYLDHEDGTSTLDSSYYSLEIIGNIHNNPELFQEGRRISFWGD